MQLILPLRELNNCGFYERFDVYIDLVTQFIHKKIKPLGVIAEFAIHPPYDLDDPQNNHWRAHILFSSCIVNKSGDGFEVIIED